MTLRGLQPMSEDYEAALPGTVYWTLSLMVEREKVAAALGRSADKCLQPEDFRRVQMGHRPSVALRNAIDPLMNDIAERESRGRVEEYLLAATGDNPDDLHEAADCARRYQELLFCPPSSIAWTTEGIQFHAHPPRLDDARIVRMRCFWLSHNNGALSYHMSFSHYYGQIVREDGTRQTGHDPSTYYFLAMLQKLAAPKEYALDAGLLDESEHIDVFADQKLGIDPLDALVVRQQMGDRKEDGDGQRFWHFVRDRFTQDARILFRRTANTLGLNNLLSDDVAHRLIEAVPFIEVPGLKVPRSRFMFMFNDERLFNRLMPLDPASGSRVRRKAVVQEPCYEPYARRMAALVAPIDGKMPRAAHLGAAPGACPPLESQQENFWDEAVGRADCLDYLFLSGFNQNIIDFMNQDTSEILDSIDPIYPSSEEQEGERFFVRYANHRAMITYVRRSRSLEAGNDYIGTCPYAFLIHALVLHNEFLARDHEEATMDRIEAINIAIEAQRTRQAERMINEVKLAEFNDFERYRYANPFRYDTEREVFAKLEELRGTSRKQEALARAIESLEDHAGDLERRAQLSRDLRLNILLGGTGLFGAGQMFYWIAEKANGADDPARAVRLLGYALPRGRVTGDVIYGITETVMGVVLILFVVAALVILHSAWREWRADTREDAWQSHRSKKRRRH